MAVGSVTYLQSALRHGWRTVALFVLLPGVAAGLAGAITGPALLDRDDGGVVRGGAIGLLTAVLGHLFFAPLFGGGWWLVEWWSREPGHVEPVAMTMATATVGFVMMAPLTLAVGAAAGAVLPGLWRNVLQADGTGAG